MLENVVYTILAGLVLSVGILSGLHALLNKRDPRSQLGWLVLCALLPLVGSIAYWIFGVNRIRTRARRWQARGLFEPGGRESDRAQAAGKLADRYPVMAENLLSLLKIGARVTGKPLLTGNTIEPLQNGEEAYPAMLEAIDAANERVYLSTYIFETDVTGRRFIEALCRAGDRGVDVRVLVDAIGARYSRPRATRLLRGHRNVRVASFLPLAPSLRGLRVNLRNHRKLLVADGSVGFTGGMNLGGRHMVEDPDNRNQTADLHFRIRGPAVYDLEEVFIEDWFFTTGDEDWQAQVPSEGSGTALCRGIKDGPNEDFEKMLWIVVGALTCASKSVKIMTPYFIPSRDLLAPLNAAALREVKVEIILPEKNNLPPVAWASQAMLWECIQYGVEVSYQPPPFNHSKLLVVDDFYVNIGSSNLDPRSLRLNFEFNLEIYDPKLGKEMSKKFDEVRARSRRVTLEDLDGRSLPIKLRDALAKLFAPYL